MSPEDAAGDQPRKKTKKSSEPSLTRRAVAGKTERAERVAAEMRKNLMKRKQQQQQQHKHSDR